ncbi:MAG TPA: efflux RND transporter periplasmic adaptor subunit [Rhizomicrobium sp.]|nr:efflux RND transporter periplasmic adaptor subunit [Rhizomicrobium sp.]
MQTIRVQTFVLAIAAVLLVGAGAGAGYWVHSGAPEAKSETSAVQPPAAQQQPAPRTPLYYQDPDGKPDYSPAPKKSADGRDYKPVYADAEPALPQTSTTPVQKKIKYYRNPMGLPDTSPVPKKDSMGMDYIPVYEGEDEAGVVTVSPARLQMLGVRTIPVETRPALARSIRATGSVQAAEDSLAIVNTKFDGFVEKLFVSTTGTVVHAGQPLAQVWVQTPDVTTRMGPDIVTREVDYIVALQQHDDDAQARALQNLRNYGIPDSAIAEIRRTGRATREIIITAPRSGVIIEKPAIEGMRFNTGDPLFKIADLSKIWVMADVAEQDLGLIRKGQSAIVGFVAFPGQSFHGTVDFLYPTLTANTRTGRVRIVLPNPDGRLRESMYAAVTIDSPIGSGAILAVPVSAIIDSGTRQVVLVTKGQGRFEPRVVKIGTRGDGQAQILSGLKPGEQVVVGANFLIDAESNLRAALQTFTSDQNTNGTAQ